MKIEIPGTITYSRYDVNRTYNWKSSKKVTKYRTKDNRIVLRISSLGFGTKPSKLDVTKKQVNLSFSKKTKWVANLSRSKTKDLTLQCYPYDKSAHSYVQIVINKSVPIELLEELRRELKSMTCISIPVIVKIDINEWKDINLKPWDFLYHTEMHAKKLMKYALENNFKVNFIPKGRSYDLLLISPRNKKFAIAILSHTAKYETRSKQHRIQKTLIDIAKMIPSLYEDRSLQPVIISEPYSFSGSWSFTSDYYLNFYKNHFNFKFIQTDFRKNWTREVCKELLRIDSSNHK